MKIKKTLKAMGLWNSKQDLRDQIWTVLTLTALCMCILVLT